MGVLQQSHEMPTFEKPNRFHIPLSLKLKISSIIRDVLRIFCAASFSVPGSHQSLSSLSCIYFLYVYIYILYADPIDNSSNPSTSTASFPASLPVFCVIIFFLLNLLKSHL